MLVAAVVGGCRKWKQGHQVPLQSLSYRLVMTSQPGIEPLAALCLQIDANWRIPESLWERLEPLLPTEGPKPKGGRPRALARQCMDGVFYVLRTGCQWKFGPASTVHDRFQEWRRAGVFEKLWQAGLVEYDRRVGLEWEWQAMDGAMTKEGNRP